MAEPKELAADAEVPGGRTGPVPEAPDEGEASASHSIPGLDLHEEHHIPRAPKSEPLRTLHFLYYVVLLKIETAVLTTLLGGVVLLPLIELINRNTRLNFWDGALSARLAYIFTFYVGFFGGAFATRYGRHISVDLVQPLLKPMVRWKLSGVLFLVSGCAAAVLTRTAYRFVFWVIAPDDRFFPSVEAWWGRDRLWKFPFIVATGLATLHFVVEGARRLATRPDAGHGGTSPARTIPVPKEGA